MSGIGFWELIILSLIGLIVLGPERLPRVANQLGSWLGQARRMTRVMKRQLEDEINFEDELNIKPPNREPSTQPKHTPPNEDDHHSEAHAKGEPGTGVSKDDDEAAVATAGNGDPEAPEEENAEAAEEAVPDKETAKEST